ncbi:MAG: epoxide hydrolase [Anaerolineae bacterium]|nr:epoxide hydrolase [Anaerolineae bacterium]
MATKQPTAANDTQESVKPFKIDVPQATLDDLQERLKRTRWTDGTENTGWEYGTDLGFMKELADYWQHHYDWRKHESYLNQFNHFKANVDGVEVHFIHERGKGPNPTPILLLHGWPDSFYRFHRVIPLLTDPARHGGEANNSFDVIVASIPGFGFSEHKALSNDELAVLFANLMTKVLGYQKFVAAGGDAGSVIIQAMALNHPDVLSGIHLTDVGYPDHTTDFASLTPPEQEFAAFIQQWWMSEGAFNMIQSTKPQTLAIAMNDSPVGMAAWLLLLLREVEDKEELLTNIMIYWVTETIGSSFRWYYAAAHAAPSPKHGQRSEVPAAVAHCPMDAPLPREWAARRVNLQHFTDFPRGGHFTAWMEPQIYAKDVADFVQQLRDRQ